MKLERILNVTAVTAISTITTAFRECFRALQVCSDSHGFIAEIRVDCRLFTQVTQKQKSPYIVVGTKQSGILEGIEQSLERF